jgi:hypothetical protein
VESEREMLSALNDREREQLTRITRKLLAHLDESAPSPTSPGSRGRR